MSAATAAALCIGLLGTTAPAAVVPAESFTLRWTHSVEKIVWRESYRVGQDFFRLTEAAIQGTGAGMEPPPEARFENGWYIYRPDRRVPEIVVPDSSFTGPMTLCAGGRCEPVAAWAQRPPEASTAVRLWPCRHPPK